MQETDSQFDLIVSVQKKNSPKGFTARHAMQKNFSLIRTTYLVFHNRRSSLAYSLIILIRPRIQFFLAITAREHIIYDLRYLRLLFSQSKCPFLYRKALPKRLRSCLSFSLTLRVRNYHPTIICRTYVNCTILLCNRQSKIFWYCTPRVHWSYYVAGHHADIRMKKREWNDRY